MTPQSSNHDTAQTLDDHIESFYQAVFEHAYELGQEFPDETDPTMVFDPCNAEDMEKLKQAIAHAIEKIIGNDELEPFAVEPYERMKTHTAAGRNHLRTEQRAALAKFLNQPPQPTN